MSNIIIGILILVVVVGYWFYKRIKIRPDTQYLIDNINQNYWKCRFSESIFYIPNGQCIWIYLGSCKPHNGINVWNLKERRAIREAIKNAHRKKLNDAKG